MVPYTANFKAEMVKKMIGPPGISGTALSLKSGVPQSTLCRWLSEARSVASVGKPTDSEKSVAAAKVWTIEEKLRVLGAAEGLQGEELGALLRREGLYDAQLVEWRAAAAGALSSAEAASSGKATAAEKRKLAVSEKRVRELEKELRRMEKALAQAAALLVFEKKLKALGWDDRDSSADEEPSDETEK
jgi:transposase